MTISASITYHSGVIRLTCLRSALRLRPSVWSYFTISLISSNDIQSGYFGVTLEVWCTEQSTINWFVVIKVIIGNFFFFFGTDHNVPATSPPVARTKQRTTCCMWNHVRLLTVHGIILFSSATPLCFNSRWPLKKNIHSAHFLNVPINHELRRAADSLCSSASVNWPLVRPPSVHLSSSRRQRDNSWAIHSCWICRGDYIGGFTLTHKWFADGDEQKM